MGTVLLHDMDSMFEQAMLDCIDGAADVGERSPDATPLPSVQTTNGKQPVMAPRIGPPVERSRHGKGNAGAKHPFRAHRSVCSGASASDSTAMATEAFGSDVGSSVVTNL